MLSVEDFKPLAKNVSASCSVPSVSGDELKCKTIEGLWIAFIAANLVDILLVVSQREVLDDTLQVCYQDLVLDRYHGVVVLTFSPLICERAGALGGQDRSLQLTVKWYNIGIQIHRCRLITVLWLWVLTTDLKCLAHETSSCHQPLHACSLVEGME